jgi:phosphoglycolate phosphatase-like HAD superfamily hydrolase
MRKVICLGRIWNLALTKEQMSCPFESQHPFFVGIDSDGCVFDTMEVKQKQFFLPITLDFWGWHQIEEPLRAVWEFVNLYSIHRGNNRFVAFNLVLDLLPTHPAFDAMQIALPDFRVLKTWLEKENQLGNPALKKQVEQTGDPILTKVLEWSETVNRAIKKELPIIHPFEPVRQTLSLLQQHADIMVVSQTPHEALVREWTTHQLDSVVRYIAGQEHGTKAEQLTWAAIERYPRDSILMVGDSPGDLQAAEQIGVCFFPILPGEETASWEIIRTEVMERFFQGSFRGSFEQEHIQAFKALLPSEPPWKKV